MTQVTNGKLQKEIQRRKAKDIFYLIKIIFDSRDWDQQSSEGLNSFSINSQHLHKRNIRVWQSCKFLFTWWAHKLDLRNTDVRTGGSMGSFPVNTIIITNLRRENMMSAQANLLWVSHSRRMFTSDKSCPSLSFRSHNCRGVWWPEVLSPWLFHASLKQ